MVILFWRSQVWDKVPIHVSISCHSRRRALTIQKIFFNPLFRNHFIFILWIWVYISYWMLAHINLPLHSAPFKWKFWVCYYARFTESWSSSGHLTFFIKFPFISKLFDYGNIIYDNCSDHDSEMLDNAQLSAAKIVLGCFKTTSSNQVLADLNLTSLNLRRKISLLCYVSKLIFNMVPCPFPASSFRTFKEFVPYALRHNQNVQIPLLKNLCPIISSSVRLPACGILYHWK